MSYLFYIEDSLDYIFRILLRRLIEKIPRESRPRYKIRFLSQGHMANSRKIEAIVKSNQNHFTKIFILRDSECTPHNVTKSFLENRLKDLLLKYPNLLRVCIVTHAIESWILYDEDPLMAIFRTKNYRLPTNIEDSEQCCRPKIFIINEFRKFGIDFDPYYHGIKIANEMDLKKLCYSRSFKEFWNKLMENIT